MVKTFVIKYTNFIDICCLKFENFKVYKPLNSKELNQLLHKASS